MAALFRRLDADGRRGETAFADLLHLQTDRQAERVEAATDGVRIDAGVDQGGKGHVATDAAETVEVQRFHGGSGLLAPKGRAMIAQGNALGSEGVTPRFSLKGRHKAR